MITAVSQGFAGLSLASILLLIALGLVLTFGQMGVINMAHGEFIMAGAYTAFVLQQVIGAPGVSLLVALPVSFLIGGALGLLLEMTLLHRMYHRPLDTLLVTWGVSLILQQVARDVFGAPNVDVAAPAWLSGAVTVLGAEVPRSRVFILLLAAAAVIVLALVIRLTSLGRRIRATVENRSLAETSGIGTRSVDRRSFFIGSGLAGIAGVALSQIGSIGPTLGTGYIVDAFLVVVVGGIGQLRGAILAALALGLLRAGLEFWDWSSATLARVGVFVAIVIFLQLRPQGIFTVRTRSLA
ncbi:urea ABC transporter permease subunit UrtB [Microlunatus sp. GCM10028923]|uniref:urea ABC transporter permease subunit UrtB n=1 Tax=Microlunatus sp. GCM10028923 TaxID=3273400 RepID=UPI003624159A